MFEGVSDNTQHLVGSGYLVFYMFLELQFFIDLLLLQGPSHQQLE